MNVTSATDASKDEKIPPLDVRGQPDDVPLHILFDELGLSERYIPILVNLMICRFSNRTKLIRDKIHALDEMLSKIKI